MLKKILKIFVYCFAVIGFGLVAGYFAVRLGWTNSPGIIDTQTETFREASAKNRTWDKGAEWETLEIAVRNDKEVIQRAAETAGVPPRLIVANLVVEQLRLYHSERELFKTIFAPLKILGNQSKFSWGVMGIKQETAMEIEEHLKDNTSPYYLGPPYKHMLEFETEDPDEERFKRLTDEQDRYYSYFYAALFLKQIEVQWQNAGFDISKKPEILSTLYNIGFKHSTPQANPRSGGALIEIKGQAYSFGSLALDFYNSSMLLMEFPQ
ncbi:MAG TPA: hypothetical protein VJH55_02925 [Candidatus Paceibacterota bacterium]